MSINQKSWQQAFRRALFVLPCPLECYLQMETKIEPDLKMYYLPRNLWAPDYYITILSISHQQLFLLLLYMRLFTAPTGKKDLLLLFFGASSGITFWHEKKDQGLYTTLLCS